MGRRQSKSNSISSSEIKKGQWTPQEDEKLFSFIQKYGHGSWRTFPQRAGLQRCGKSCRLRWKNYLNPNIKRGNFSPQGDQTIIQLHALLGNKWSAIAGQLPKRTDNEIKNHWNTHLKKKLERRGFDPVTRKHNTSSVSAYGGDQKTLSNLSHVAHWETARLQAEARFARQSKLGQSQPNAPTSLDMNEREKEVLLLLKSVLYDEELFEGSQSGSVCNAMQVGQENMGYEGLGSNCDDLFMATGISNTSDLDNVGDEATYYDYGRLLEAMLL